jgi:hypothetical protein
MTASAYGLFFGAGAHAPRRFPIQARLRTFRNIPSAFVRMIIVRKRTPFGKGNRAGEYNRFIQSVVCNQ